MSDLETIQVAPNASLLPPSTPKLVELPTQPGSTSPPVTAYQPVTGISRESQLAAFQALLDGGMPLEQVQAHAAAEGLNFGIDPRSVEQRSREEIAEHLAPLSAKPEAYRFDLVSHSRAANLAAKGYDADAFAESAREWSSKLQLPPAVADEIVGRAVDFAFQTERMSQADLEKRDFEAQEKLNYCATRRGITVEKMLENARAVLAAGGKFSGRLDASGVLGCWPIVVELSDHFSNMKTAYDLRTR